MIGTQAGLGVGASTDVLLFVMCVYSLTRGVERRGGRRVGSEPRLTSSWPSPDSASPVGPYYSTGFKPVKLYATTKDVRAWPGGTGGYKLGSNYAAGVVPQQQAAALGYQQILWLFGPEHRLTEVGTMNLWVGLKGTDGGASRTVRERPEVPRLTPPSFLVPAPSPSPAHSP